MYWGWNFGLTFSKSQKLNNLRNVFIRIFIIIFIFSKCCEWYRGSCENITNVKKYKSKLFVIRIFQKRNKHFNHVVTVSNVFGSWNPLKMMKNAFYFPSKALFVLKIYDFLSSDFGHVARRLDKKDSVNFKLYDVTSWLTNDRNTHIAQYLQK